MSVIHKLKASLLDPEADNYDPDALTRYVSVELPEFVNNYGQDWGIDPDDVWFPEESDGASVQFFAEDCLRSLAEELSDDHPGLFFELYYCAPGEFSGIAEFVQGEQWDERRVETTGQGRELSRWHEEQLTGED